jgi:ferredoxin
MKSIERSAVHQQQLKIYPEFCARVRSSKSSCSHCLQSCPLGAVTIGKSIEIKKNCITCGICIAACPNGVFEALDMDEGRLTFEMKQLLEQNPHKRIVFQCGEKQSEEKEVVSLLCLSGLTESALLMTFLLGAERVELAHSDCDSCLIKRPSFNLSVTLRHMNVLLPLVGILKDQLVEVQQTAPPPFPKDLPLQSPKAPVSRREFFNFFKREVKDRVDGFSEGFSDNKSATLPSINPKRDRLLQILRGFPDLDSSIADNGSLPFADLEITDQCIGCNVCEALCPSNALKRSNTNNTLAITFDGKLCTGCRLCEEVCIRGAIRWKSSFDLKEIITGHEKNLIKLPEKMCQVCGQPFWGGEEKTCFFCSGAPKPLCRNSSKQHANPH